MIQDPAMKISPSAQNREANHELIELLETLGTLRSDYPAELLTSRRAAFILKVNEQCRLNYKVIQPFDK